MLGTVEGCKGMPFAAHAITMFAAWSLVTPFWRKVFMKLAFCVSAALETPLGAAAGISGPYICSNA